MQAALVQLGQGLAAGTLRGEELNSVMEQTPRLARAIADGLNVPIGKLREIGAAGVLTAEQVIEALERSSVALAREVSGATLTFGQSLTQLQNAAIKAAGEIDSTAGITSGLAAEVQDLTQFVGELVAAGNELGVFKTIAETVKLLWSDVKFVFSGVGTEIGIIAAQLAQLAQGQPARGRRDPSASRRRRCGTAQGPRRVPALGRSSASGGQQRGRRRGRRRHRAAQPRSAGDHSSASCRRREAGGNPLATWRRDEGVRCRHEGVGRRRGERHHHCQGEGGPRAAADPEAPRCQRCRKLPTRPRRARWISSPWPRCSAGSTLGRELTQRRGAGDPLGRPARRQGRQAAGRGTRAAAAEERASGRGPACDRPGH
jgi:tape measure domain-containing protein